LLWRCDLCGREEARRCQNHRESRCKPCSGRYRRRVRRVAEAGTRRPTGYLYLLTLTPPGTRRHCKRGNGCEWKRRGQDCQHPDACECTPAGGVDLGEWNPSAAAKWNHLRTLIRRDEPGVEFFRAVEVQDGKHRADGHGRGALHLHVMTWSPTPLDIAHLRTLALRAGFGHSVDLAYCEPGSRRAAYYVAKYVTKACDAREDVPWVAESVDLRTGEIARGPVTARYRTWSTSRGWGMTMAAVRADAAAYAATRAAALAATAEADALALLGAVLNAVPLEPAEPPPPD
jgi:hypothetical protein